MYIPDNNLIELDVSNNDLLEELQCQQNELSSLDLTNNLALTTLFKLGQYSNVHVLMISDPDIAVSLWTVEGGNIDEIVFCHHMQFARL